MTQTPRLQRPSAQRVTLADVARKLGVSTMTVSRAMSGRGQVSSELRERIEKVALELGYVPNGAARALASARSNIISVIVPSLSNGVFTSVLAGIEDALKVEQYQIIIGNTRYSDKDEEQLIRVHLQSNPDGILITGLSQTAAVRRMLEISGVPTVSMMDHTGDPQRLSVGLSQHDAGYTITRHLLDKGYRRIGFLGAQLDERVLKRLEGHRKALRDAGVYESRREVMVPDQSTIGVGAELIGRLLSVAPDCDAVFCCNDDLAYGAIYQCQRRGIAIPGQLAICGFNDLPASAWMKPSVTTIATPLYRIGFESASLLKRAINGDQGVRSMDLGFTLMEREST
jgi:LacI family transcriptional regulator, gluconate utilization system Gnt-I transcriptional repressor